MQRGGAVDLALRVRAPDCGPGLKAHLIPSYPKEAVHLTLARAIWGH